MCTCLCKFSSSYFYYLWPYCQKTCFSIFYMSGHNSLTFYTIGVILGKWVHLINTPRRFFHFEDRGLYLAIVPGFRPFCWKITEISLLHDFSSNYTNFILPTIIKFDIYILLTNVWIYCNFFLYWFWWCWDMDPWAELTKMHITTIRF